MENYGYEKHFFGKNHGGVADLRSSEMLDKILFVTVTKQNVLFSRCYLLINQITITY